MSNFTELYTVEELKEMFVEIMLNKTDKISKISEGSVNNAIAFGNAKIGQKINKDIAVLESYLYPDASYGEKLDNVAKMNGISLRFGARQSSTYIRIVAAPNTIYEPGVNVFSSSAGQNFDLEQRVIIPEIGYAYAKIRSQNVGKSTNVDALTINRVSSPPAGHIYCINEYASQYGMDAEEDSLFRKRIKDGPNLLARGTISMLEQGLMKINQNIMRIFHNGFDNTSRTIISILTVNGINLSEAEMNDLLIRGEKLFTLTEMRPTGINGSNIKFQNVEWEGLDISFRCDLEQSYNPDEVRREIQIRLNKYIDYRYWRLGQRIEWDNMLELVKTTPGVRYVNDNYFFPNNDVSIDLRKLPRIRGFQMLDLSGNIIRDLQGNLNPIYYPNDVDSSYQSTVLSFI